MNFYLPIDLNHLALETKFIQRNRKLSAVKFLELVFKSWKTDMGVDYYRTMKLARWECHFYAELILLLLSMLVTYQLRIYLWEEKRIVLSEQITMREVSKRIWKIWQARDALDWQEIINKLLKMLARIGRKNTKNPTPWPIE